MAPRHYYTGLMPLPDRGAHPHGRVAGECHACGYPEEHPIHVQGERWKPTPLTPEELPEGKDEQD